MSDQLIEAAKEILEGRYPEAATIFLAGSLVRGEGTAYSDLDLVVVFDRLPNAYRESFYFRDYPVEAFVHDPATLNYFLYEIDRPRGIPSLAQMISEGVEIPASDRFSRSLKELAAAVLEMGPPVLSDDDIRQLRYNITNLVDDIREPRSADEPTAAGTELYQALADYYFRANNLWSAKGKSIPRKLKQSDDALCLRYCDSFEELFVGGRPERVIALAEEILKPNGGFFFEGHRLDAPAGWRNALI